MHIEQMTFINSDLLKEGSFCICLWKEKTCLDSVQQRHLKTPAAKKTEIKREKRLLGVEKINQMFLVNYELWKLQMCVSM